MPPSTTREGSVATSSPFLEYPPSVANRNFVVFDAICRIYGFPLCSAVGRNSKKRVLQGKGKERGTLVREPRARGFLTGDLACYAFSIVRETGTGFRTMSSTGDVLCTYAQSSSSFSREASRFTLQLRRMFWYPGRTRSDNPRNPCKSISPCMEKLSDSTSMSRAAAMHTISTGRQEASAERTVSTAFGPTFEPSNTGGSSPSRTNGEFRDASSAPAPYKPWIFV